MFKSIHVAFQTQILFDILPKKLLHDNTKARKATSFDFLHENPMGYNMNLSVK